MSEQHIRPINNDEDYNRALKRVEFLMEKNLSSNEEDEINVLATLIEVYEDKYFPMDDPDPIEAIKFRMEQMGKTQSDLAPLFGSRSKVSEVLSGKRDLTLKMIRSLHENLGIPAEVLIGNNLGLPNAPEGIDLDKFPVKEMAKRGWIKRTIDVKDRVEEVVRDLIDCAGGQKALPQALFRQGGGSRANSNTDANALQAWCLHVLCEARREKLEGIYEEGTINQEFLRNIARLSIFSDGPRLAKEELANNGIALIVAKHLPKTYLDGAALWTIDKVPVVGMTIRYDRIDNFWFCLMHELAHLGRHFSEETGEVFIDDLQLRSENSARDDVREQEADEWALEALIPSDLWNTHPIRQFQTVRNVISFAQKAKVHPAVVAGRVRYEQKNYRLLSQFVGAKEVSRVLMEDSV